MPNLQKLSDTDKGRVIALYAKLYAKSFDKRVTLTAKNYDRIRYDVKSALFSRVKSALFPGNIDNIEIAMDLPTRLKTKLEDSDVSDHAIDKVIDSLGDLNKQVPSESRIKAMMVSQGLAIDENDLVICKNEATSANNTYIVNCKNSGDRYYAKSFDGEMSLNGKINQNELFIYKVMQYLDYGPTTEFLVKLGSSSGGHVGIYTGNFILTKDVATDGRKFFLDKTENEPYFRACAGSLGGDGSSGGGVSSTKFAVEISAAAALVDILSLTDVFGENPCNYGIVGNPEQPSEYKLQFVDCQYVENRSSLGRGCLS